MHSVNEKMSIKRKRKSKCIEVRLTVDNELFVYCAVEFPAVLLNTRSGEVEDEFHRYVQPQECPILSDFCKQLTGISQVHCCLIVA